jgi:hypothetical protein
MAPKPATHGIFPDTHVWPSPSEWGTFSSPSATGGEQLDADHLFDTLDGRGITTPQGAWFVEIQSIYDEGLDRWLQLTLTGHPTYTLTFKLHVGDDASEAVRALSMWLTSVQPQDVM